MARSKNEETGQIVIRPPAGMRDRIKAAADANNRSMNAEIVATLEEKYPKPPEELLEARETIEQAFSAMNKIYKEDNPSKRVELLNNLVDLAMKVGALAERYPDVRDILFAPEIE